MCLAHVVLYILVDCLTGPTSAVCANIREENRGHCTPVALGIFFFFCSVVLVAHGTLAEKETFTVYNKRLSRRP